MKNQLISCAFNMDTACVELRYTDGSVIAIDCDAVEAETAKNLRQRTELNWLIYNSPVEYAALILSDCIEKYLKMSDTGL